MRLVTQGLGAAANVSHLLLFGLVPGAGLTLTGSPEWAYTVGPSDMSFAVPADDLTYTVDRR